MNEATLIVDDVRGIVSVSKHAQPMKQPPHRKGHERQARRRQATFGWCPNFRRVATVNRCLQRRRQRSVVNVEYNRQGINLDLSTMGQLLVKHIRHLTDQTRPTLDIRRIKNIDA